MRYGLGAHIVTSLIEQAHDPVPHLDAAFIRIPVRVVGDLGVGAEFKPTEDNAASFRHALLALSYPSLKFGQGSEDQHGVVNRSADFNAGLSHQATR